MDLKRAPLQFFNISPQLWEGSWVLWLARHSGRDTVTSKSGTYKAMYLPPCSLKHSCLEPTLQWEMWLLWGHHGKRKPSCMGSIRRAFGSSGPQLLTGVKESLHSFNLRSWVTPSLSAYSWGPTLCKAKTVKPAVSSLSFWTTESLSRIKWLFYAAKFWGHLLHHW